MGVSFMYIRRLSSDSCILRAYFVWSLGAVGVGGMSTGGGGWRTDIEGALKHTYSYLK